MVGEQSTPIGGRARSEEVDVDDDLEMVQDEDVEDDGPLEGWMPSLSNSDCKPLQQDGSRSCGASPVPRLLPLQRALPRDAPAPPQHDTSQQVVESADASHTVDPDEASSETEHRPSSPTVRSDRVGLYFGYNGTDGNVPKPAYDAMAQRVNTLEDALGTANRELRTQSKVITDQQARLTSLQQQLLNNDEMLHRLGALEAQLLERERALDAREQSLELIARQQRKGNRRLQHTSSEDPPTYNHQDHSPTSSHIRMIHELSDGAIQRGALRRRGSDERLRREEEVYAQWVRPSGEPVGSPAQGSRRTSNVGHTLAGRPAAALLEADRARRRIQGTTTVNGGLPRLDAQQQLSLLQAQLQHRIPAGPRSQSSLA